jgi:hypothetical protein
VTEFQREIKRKKRVIEYAEFGSTKRSDTATADEDEIRDSGNYAELMARREGFASSLRLRRPLRRVASPATPLVAALPLFTR